MKEIILIFGLFFPLVVFCQIQDSVDLQYDEITISANRIELPFNENSRTINIISKNDIKGLNPSSVNELLQVVAGVDVRQRGVGGVQADVSIRGGTFEQTLVLINGVKMIDPQTGHHLLNLPVNINSIERVEILKGPSARIYGVNAFTGVINIVTKTSKSTDVQLGFEYGENELLKADINLSLPINNYQQTIGLSHNSSDGYRYNSDYQINNIFYHSKLALQNGSLSFMGGHIDNKFGASQFYGNETFTEQYEEVHTTFGALTYESTVLGWQISPQLNWRRNNDNWQFNRANPEFFQNFHTSNVYNGALNLSKAFTNSILGVGVEYLHADLNSSNLSDHERSQISVHVENRLLFFDEKLDVTPGFMLMNVTEFGTEIFPGLDIGYAVNNHFKVFGNIGWTTRIPTFTDLYYEDAGNVGNAFLQEENALTTELGFKFHKDNIHLQTSIFRREAKDQIDWFKLNESDKWMPDNFSNANYTGIELNVEARFTQFALRMGYSYLNAELGQNNFLFSRNQLENLRHQVILNPRVNLGSFRLNAVFKFNDRVSLDDYYTVDLHVNYKVKQFMLFIKGNNITGQIYRESNLVEMPQRWMSSGLRYSF